MPDPISEADINYMARRPLFGSVPMNSIDFSGARAPGVPVPDLPEIVAWKPRNLHRFPRPRALDQGHRRLRLKVFSVIRTPWPNTPNSSPPGASQHRSWFQVGQLEPR